MIAEASANKNSTDDEEIIDNDFQVERLQPKKSNEQQRSQQNTNIKSKRNKKVKNK
jgi:hypothetical protein